MESKTCTKCNINKLYSEFYKSKKSKNGYRSECTECKKLYNHLNANKIRERCKNYNLLNASTIIKYNKQRYLLNPRKQEHQQYYQQNKTSIIERIRKYLKTPQGRLVKRAGFHKRRALIKDNTPIGKHFKPKDIKLKFKLQHGKCVYCEISIKEYFEIDHIIPLSKGGSNEASNIQLLCQKCNGCSGKWDKMPDEFAQQHGKLF